MHLEKRQRTGSASIVTSKNPFQIGYTDGIFAVQLMFWFFTVSAASAQTY